MGDMLMEKRSKNEDIFTALHTALSVKVDVEVSANKPLVLYVYKIPCTKTMRDALLRSERLL